MPRIVRVALAALACGVPLAFAEGAAASFPGNNGLISFVISEVDTPGFVGLFVDRPFAARRRSLVPAGDDASFSPGGSTIVFGTSDGGVAHPTRRLQPEGGLDSRRERLRPAVVTPCAGVGVRGVHDPRPGGDVYTAPTTPIVGPGQGGIQQLTVGGGGDPDWSLKERIAFEQALNQTAPITAGIQLFAVNPDGSGLQQLTRRGGQDPSWSPHGGFMAFTRKNQIYKMSVPSSGTGRNATKLTGKGGSNPIWSPDGKWIAFARGNRVYVMTTNGKRLRRVATAGDGFFFSQLGRQPVP
jgi:Tol biopolymer transport system component